MSKSVKLILQILIIFLNLHSENSFAANLCKNIFNSISTHFILNQSAVDKYRAQFRQFLTQTLPPVLSVNELEGKPPLEVIAHLYWEYKNSESALLNNWLNTVIKEFPLVLSPEERAAIQLEINPLDPIHKFDDWLIDIIFGLSRKDINLKLAPVHKNSDTAVGTWPHLLPDGYNTSYRLLDEMLLRANLKDGDIVVDMGSGLGRLGILIGKKYPNLKYVGYEFWMDRIQPAMNVAQQDGLRNVNYVHADFSTPDFTLVRGDLFFAYQPNSSNEIMAVMTKKLREVAKHKAIRVVTRIGSREFLDHSQQFLILEDMNWKAMQFWNSNPGFLGQHPSRFSEDILNRKLTSEEIDELNRLLNLAMNEDSKIGSSSAIETELNYFSNKDLVILAELYMQNWELVVKNPQELNSIMISISKSIEYRTLTNEEELNLSRWAKSYWLDGNNPGLKILDIIFNVPKSASKSKNKDPYSLFTKIFSELSLSKVGKFIDLISGDVRPAVIHSKMPELNFQYLLIAPSYYDTFRIKRELDVCLGSNNDAIFAPEQKTMIQVKQNENMIQEIYSEGDVAFFDSSDPIYPHYNESVRILSLLKKWSLNHKVRFVTNASAEELREGLGEKPKNIRSLSFGYNLFEIDQKL